MRNPSAARCIVIKIGSAVLSSGASLDIAAINSLAGQIANVRSLAQDRRVVVVSSGAVAAGRAVMAARGRPVGSTAQTAKQALAAIGQPELMRAWSEAFAPLGITIAQALLTRDDFRMRDRFQHAADAFSEMLAWGILPIINENDTVAVHELRFGDNDTLASLLVNLVHADLFINLTSAPGVFAANPDQEPDAAVMPVIEDIAALDIAKLCGAKTEAGSGGMHSKLLAARRVSQLGVPTLILPGKKAGVLARAFEPDCPAEGTWVCPAAKAIPRRKFWMAYQSEPEGTVEIDAGAAEALIHKGRSLLPGGITRVKGSFAKGALIRIEHDSEMLGVGFSNYSSKDLELIHHRRRHEIAAILGDANYPDVIHRNNMLLDAAL